LSSEVGVHAYYADLVVIPQPQPGGQTARPPGLAESLVLTSGRPIIVFPPRSTVSRVRRVLVGWNARRESIRAVADAMPLLVKAETVEVLVADHERTAGHGQEPGADIARHLARRGVHVEVRRLSSGGEGEDVGRLALRTTRVESVKHVEKDEKRDEVTYAGFGTSTPSRQPRRAGKRRIRKMPRK
jgi:hypothetical protein